jgi:spore coat protein CotH
VVVPHTSVAERQVASSSVPDSSVPESSVPDSTVPRTSEAPPTTVRRPAEPSAPDRSAMLFDQAVLHEVEMQITDQSLALLDPPTDDRVPVRLTVDGETIDGAGVRLKQGFSQFQGLDKKPGFSIETDEFVDGLELYDVDRFTLGNATWDRSFVAEQLVYELARAAGIPAARTALARVTLNGETFGIYVMRETYDERWLELYFADPTGNLYESAGQGDEPDTVLELRTNEDEDDTSDLAAVAEVVATASDEDYRAAIEALVDVDELLSYWAIEAMTAHWDGYVYDITAPGRVPPPARPQGNPYPNNYYAYHDPQSDRFVIIPHGADLSFGIGDHQWSVDPSTPVLVAPKQDATIAARLWDDPEFREELAARIRWVLDELWDVAALTERAEALGDLVRADGLSGTRETISMATFEDALAAREEFIALRYDAVRAELEQWATGDQQREPG